MSDFVPAEVFPPGEFIKEELEYRGWSQVDLAVILDRAPQVVSDVISAKRTIGPELAQSLAEAFGTSPEYWMNLESAYRLSLARGHDENISRRSKLFDKAPVSEMIKRGWIPASKDVNELEQSILRFYEIDSIDEEPALMAAARKSTDYEETTIGQRAWFYRAWHMAKALEVANVYSKEAFQKAIPRLRALAVEPEEARKVPLLLSELGIRFVVVEHLPKTKIDGAAFWLSETEPAVAISLRYDRIDAFWHTLSHELAHIFNGDAQQLDTNLVDGHHEEAGQRPEREIKADSMACSLTVPQDKLDSFVTRVKPAFSKARIVQFSNLHGVHPGVVVGQLQHRREIGWQHSREMLVKIRQIVTETAMTDGWGHLPDLAI